MHIDRLEGTFLWLSGVMLVVFAGAIMISAKWMRYALAATSSPMSK